MGAPEIQSLETNTMSMKSVLAATVAAVALTIGALAVTGDANAQTVPAAPVPAVSAEPAKAPAPCRHSGA